MADYPDHLHPGRHRDMEGRRHQPWVRRALVSLLLALIVLGLFNVFGQRSETSRAAGPAASLEIRGPTKVRGGLLFQQHITITATRAIAFPRLVLGPGFTDGLQLNTIEPGPQSESSRDGRLVLSYDRLAAGDTLEIWMQFQANPTHVGSTDMGIELDDQTRPLATISRHLRTFP